MVGTAAAVGVVADTAIAAVDTFLEKAGNAGEEVDVVVADNFGKEDGTAVADTGTVGEMGGIVVAAVGTPVALIGGGIALVQFGGVVAETLAAVGLAGHRDSAE